MQALAFRPDGKFLAIGLANHHVYLWDAETRKSVHELRGHIGELEALAFSPDGKTLASGDTRGVLKLWDTSTPRGVVREVASLRAQLSNLSAIAYTGNGATLVTSGSDGAELWRPQGRLERFRWDWDDQGAESVAVSADGRVVAAGGRLKVVKVWNGDTGKESKILFGHLGPVVGLALSKDGKALTALSFRFDQKEHEVKEWEFKTWDLESGRDVHFFRRAPRDFVTAALSPDGQAVAVATGDGAVTLWNANGSQGAVWRGHSPSAQVFAYAPDGRTLAIGDDKGMVRLWDVAAGKERLQFTASPAPVLALAFSNDGGQLATSGIEKWENRVITDLRLKVWNAASGQLVRTMQSPLDVYRRLAFSADGRTLAAAGRDCTVKLWDITSGHFRAVLPGHRRPVTALAFTADGRRLAAASGALHEGWWVKEGDVMLWEVGGP